MPSCAFSPMGTCCSVVCCLRRCTGSSAEIGEQLSEELRGVRVEVAETGRALLLAAAEVRRLTAQQTQQLTQQQQTAAEQAQVRIRDAAALCFVWSVVCAYE